MSFIATAPSSPSTPNTTIVTNDGFFTDIDLDKLRESMRLDGTVTLVRLRDAAIAAVISVNDELAAWKAEKLAAGTVDLASMLPQIGGESRNVHLYLTAVYRTAKADLTERYRDFDATNSGDAKADKLEETVCEDRRAARWAIRDMLGLPRSTIELI